MYKWCDSSIARKKFWTTVDIGKYEQNCFSNIFDFKFTLGMGT